nr:glycine zipper 2TM domain-containing protein [Ramlibacter ginsenosidimutans]
MRRFILLAAAAVVFAAPAARAHGHDDEHEHGHGHGWGHGDKEEYWDGNCRVERKWKHGEMEEKRKCRAPETVVVVPAQPAPPPQVVYVYPPWIVRQQNEYVYAPQYQPQQVVTGVSYCHSEAVGQVLGGVVGGALGSQIGRGNGRTAATIGGAIAGVLVGGDVGRRMDAGNQACLGQVLEVAPVNHRVQWVEGPSTYVVVPAQAVMRHGTYCRPYTVEVRGPHGVQHTRGNACRRGDGVWIAA